MIVSFAMSCPAKRPLPAIRDLPIQTCTFMPRSFCWVIAPGALIRYYFDYERARIWRLGALETSRHDRSVQRPCRGFGGATWAGSVLRRVAPDQTEARANSYAVGRSCSASSVPILPQGEQFPRVICLLAPLRSHYKIRLYQK